MSHHSTILSQLLQSIDRHDFNRIEKQGFLPDRSYRKLTRWGQFVAMAFSHLTQRTSLRDLEGQFDAHSSKLYHAGAAPVKRSTLADANNQRPAEFFEEVFYHMAAKCQSHAPKHKFRFKNPLYSMDSSVVDLCLNLFPWAKHRSTKAGIKIHTVLDHSGYIPAFVRITDAKTSDIEIARTLSLPKGSILVEDRAYVDFTWFKNWHENKQFFVTRLKKNIKYKVLERRDVPQNKGVTSDQIIKLTGKKAADCPNLRRVGYWDKTTKKHYVYLTNLTKLSARTIADIYKDRWQIELFFKWIKQNLRIKSFLGNSRNAVLTQIWTAMISMLILAYYKWRAKIGATLTEMLKLLQLTLMERRNLYELFEPPDPGGTPSSQNQLPLNFSIF
ncbi:transposase IS4 family protein [Desulfatibacillum aliphaticivorans]|uniref:Transposase IS4 family protein n=1 Tax=Desulfatibacillum aliphaticivorans TaxID=218208 RepID=B8FI31_DESAL|nr:IS4 family transposase [Desulfatibacillum aliphaticivorans]ACL02598.1 transposase IS4 family protein [Desulfatibacillum aliphaticivorans]